MRNALAGMSFCVTGVLSVTREEIHTLIEDAGGEVHKTVKQGTTYLVIGDKVGETKISKASALGTRILTENGLMDMIEQAT